MLRPLLDRKSLVILGLNSGTSADGLDLAAVRVTHHSRSVAIKFLSGKTVPYPLEIRRLILNASDSPNTTVVDLVSLDNLLGQFYGRAARSYLSQLRRQSIRVDAIASHGQTVRHLPRPVRVAGYTVHGTLQIGSLSHIATLTKCVTVGDFRQGDIALGGEGAPITVAAMKDIFGSVRNARIIVNVGGMSNYFYFPPGDSTSGVRAADCGPGNVLSDLLCRRLYKSPYDRNGAHASRGSASRRLLTTLLASPYFVGAHRSTGREEFGELMANRIITLGKKLQLTADDLLATAVELTAQAIVAAVSPYLSKRPQMRRRQLPVDGLYLTGGGSHNRFLKNRLSELLGGLPVTTVRDLGIDPDLVEATAFAVMGGATLRSRPLVTRFDGRNQNVRAVLGTICQPPVHSRRKG
jgi:anhydro-N-acetylmuramic acid kinase